jgi:hypothetical protein
MLSNNLELSMTSTIDGELLKERLEELFDHYLFKAEIENNPQGPVRALAERVSDLVDNLMCEAPD